MERDKIPKLKTAIEATALGIGTNGFQLLFMMFEDGVDTPIAVMTFGVDEAQEMKQILIASIDEAVAKVTKHNGAIN